MTEWIVKVSVFSVMVLSVADSGLSIPTECTLLLDELGVALRNFDQCALDNSRPFEVCRRCVSPYAAAHALFSDVINLRSPRSIRCRTLVEEGRVSLVKVNFQHIENIWTSWGVCSDCFAPNTFNISEQVMGFFDLREELRKCLDSTWDFNTTCDECDDEFRNLTNYFANELHSEANKGRCLCLDILDAMNQTRSVWGDRCYLRKDRLDSSCILATSIACLATAAFYVISRLAQRPRDTELARVNTLQSVMLEEECECGAAEDEPCCCPQQQGKYINGDTIQ